MFGRRNESARLWIVRRTDIQVLEDQDLLDPPLDRSFKKPGGYTMRDKLAAARERAGTSKPPARADGHDRTGRRGKGAARGDETGSGTEGDAAGGETGTRGAA
jgi:hypothetical protein